METQSELLNNDAGPSAITTFCHDLQRKLAARGVWVGLPDDLLKQPADPGVWPASLLHNWLGNLLNQDLREQRGVQSGSGFDWSLTQPIDELASNPTLEIDQSGGSAPNLFDWAAARLFFSGLPAGLLLAVRRSPFDLDDLASFEEARRKLLALLSETQLDQPAAQMTSELDLADLLVSGDGPDLRERLRDMAALHQLSLQINTVQDLQPTLQMLVQSVHAILPGANTISLMLRDERGLLRLAASDGLASDQNMKAIPLRAGEGLRGQVVLLGRPLYVPIVHIDRRYVDFDRGLGSMLIVPLRGRDQVLGILSAESRVPNNFSAYDQNILTIAAALAANAVEKDRLYQNEHRRATETNALIELGRTIARNLEIEPVFTTAHQTVTRLMPCEAFYISLRDTQSRSTSVTHLIDNGVRYPPARWPIESGLSGYVIRTGEQILVRDTIKDKLPFQGVFYGKQDQVRSIIACPLRFQGRTKGMVSCQSYQPDAFSSHDLQLLQAIADLIAIGVESIEMHIDLQNRYLTLQELERVRSEIIQNVSHELRTPLTFLRSYVEILLDESLGSLNERQKNSLSIVQARTNTMVRLVDDIAMLEVDDPEWLQLSDVDLAELAANALQVSEQLAQERGNQLILEAPSDFPPVRADPDRINQVLDNLLGNALKYGQKASKIVVRLEVDVDNAIVSVSNQGTGIPTREQERIFERFYQIDGSISRLQSGLGLGLAIVKRIIEAHHGTVWVQSDIDTGSTFYFSLPIQSSSEQSQEF